MALDPADAGPASATPAAVAPMAIRPPASITRARMSLMDYLPFRWVMTETIPRGGAARLSNHYSFTGGGDE